LTTNQDNTLFIVLNERLLIIKIYFLRKIIITLYILLILLKNYIIILLYITLIYFNLRFQRMQALFLLLFIVRDRIRSLIIYLGNSIGNTKRTRTNFRVPKTQCVRHTRFDENPGPCTPF